MNPNNITRLLAVLGFCLGATGLLSSTAHAQGFYVMLDCHGTNHLPSWSHTSSTITIKAKIDGFYNTLWSYPPDASWCNDEDEVVSYFGAFTADDVERIRVSTGGEDVFWIDEVLLQDADTYWQGWWGTDNNTGYCISQDPHDGENSYCLNGTAYSAFDFIN